MNGFIKISVLEIDSSDIQYVIKLSSELCSTSLDFYAHANIFKAFGTALTGFPKDVNDVVVFQLGKDDPKYSDYLNLKAFCYDGSGYSAIRVVAVNNAKGAYSYRTEFSIFAEAASLNMLGESLIKWNPELEAEFYWESNESS